MASGRPALPRKAIVRADECEQSASSMSLFGGFFRPKLETERPPDGGLPKSDRVHFSWSAWANRQTAAGPEGVASFLILRPCGDFQCLIGEFEGKDVFIHLLTSHHNVRHVIHPFVRWIANVLILVDVERAQAGSGRLSRPYRGVRMTPQAKRQNHKCDAEQDRVGGDCPDQSDRAGSGRDQNHNTEQHRQQPAED